MRVLVVHESLFGSTARVAGSVAAGVRRAHPDAQVAVLPVADAPADAVGVDLLVVGGPTHFWGTTSSLTREMERQYENRIRPALRGVPSSLAWRPRTLGVREWLAALPPSAGAAAAFDTRIDRPLTGGAACGIARALRRRGRALVAAPEGFVVDGITGPLRPGELDRAESWGASLTLDQITITQAAARVAVRETSMNTTPVLTTDHAVPSGARSTLVRPAPADAPRHLDLTRVITTTEIVIGAVLVARELARRPGSSKALVTMGPGGWVSMRGGTVAVRPARRPFGRPRPLPASATDVRRVPLWARVISAVPLQRLVG
jgi:hypothetical protein